MNSSGKSFWQNGSVPLIEPEFLGSIVNAASDIAIIIDGSGIVQSVMVNETEANYAAPMHWEGQPITNFLAEDSLGKMSQVLTAFGNGKSVARSMELNHKDPDPWSFPIRYTFHNIGYEGTILMLGRDLHLVAETQKQLVQAQIALERGYEARREFDARYRLLLATVHDAIVFVAVSDGRIRDLNSAAATLLGSSSGELNGAPFASEFKDRRKDEFIESLMNLAISESATDVVVQTRRTRKELSILPAVFRAGGERLLICRLRLGNEIQFFDDQLASDLHALFRVGTEAVVFTDGKGVIGMANDSFLDLTGLAHLSDVKGRSLTDFLARGQIDMNVLLENVIRDGSMRMYATKLSNDYGTKTPVEVSATVLSSGAHVSIGFVIRDASRVEAVRRPSTGMDENGQGNNVMELVGSVPLRDIVSETTDVVERMCIETAVELTRNNRVAAAEMLGLSRQSLYVKLRKYGLLNKSGDE